MQKLATRIFIAASVAFGVLGIIMVLTGTDPGDNRSNFGILLSKVFLSTIFIILPSFALSIASKYLNGKS